jgi:hypothetical protein
VLLKLRALTGKIYGAADDHPNKMPFKGTLVLLGVPSTKPPHGARGHRIQLSKEVTKRRLKDLIGMGLNYSPSLEEHAPRRKVGVITGAWIDGNAVKVKGIIYKKDFPEAVKDLKTSGLGMSMELADVYVSDEDATIWQLEDFRFTGATVLYKKAAAYYQTALAAQHGRDREQHGGIVMKTDKAKKKTVTNQRGNEVLVTIIASAVKQGVTTAVQPLVEQNVKLGKRLARIAASQEALSTRLDEALLTQDEDIDDVDTAIDADADEDDDEDVDASADEDEDEDEEPIRAAKKKDNSADDDDDADGYADDEDDVEATNDDPDMTDLNDNDVDDKTKKTTSTGKTGKKAPKPGLAARGRMTASAVKLDKQNRKLREQLQAVAAASTKKDAKLRKLATQVETVQAQVDRYAEMVDRRTISPEVRTLLAKAGHDIGDLLASGSKLDTDAVDKAFRDSGLNLDVVARIALKNQLVQNGLMGQGEIKRMN